MFDTKIGKLRISAIYSHIQNIIHERGIFYVLFMLTKVLLFLPPSYMFAKKFNSRSRFLFQGEVHLYEISWYNMTWRTERVIEVPIFKRLLENYSGSDVLEIGNVMKHYGITGHDVVDKYEREEDIIVRIFWTLKQINVTDSLSAYLLLSTSARMKNAVCPRKPSKRSKRFKVFFAPVVNSVFPYPSDTTKLWIHTVLITWMHSRE
jgi:hypothetical protein